MSLRALAMGSETCRSPNLWSLGKLPVCARTEGADLRGSRRSLGSRREPGSRGGAGSRCETGSRRSLCSRWRTGPCCGTGPRGDLDSPTGAAPPSCGRLRPERPRPPRRRGLEVWGGESVLDASAAALGRWLEGDSGWLSFLPDLRHGRNRISPFGWVGVLLSFVAAISNIETFGSGHA